jgi:fumigallin biosynthesis monooxygenase-like protein
MTEVINGRHTAAVDGDVVVFIIGMRINRLRRLRSWLPAFRAMPRMLAELSADPDLGLLGVQSFWAGRVIMGVQYWRSFDDLQAFARSKDHAHLPAWREFNRLVRDNGDVGIFHETYRVGPGTTETFYGNMPPFGMAAAVGMTPVDGRGHSAARRMGVTATDVPAVAPY